MTRLIPQLRGPLLWLLLGLAAVAAGCGSDETAATGASSSVGATEASTERPAANFPLTVTDSSGVETVIAAEATRIISYSPAVTEILFAIGAGDRVVGRDTYSDYPASALSVAELDALTPNPEAALALEPELVVFPGYQQTAAEQFRALGMSVLFADEADSVEGVYESILLFGELTGSSSDAEALVQEMRERIKTVTDAIADVERGPRVFYEISADLYTASPGTFIGNMLTLLKAQNVAEGAASLFPQLSAEAVIDADPEVVFLSDAEFGESAETVGARPGWSEVSAVVNGRIIPVDSDIVDRPGPRIVEGIAALARALYPDRFE